MYIESNDLRGHFTEVSDHEMAKLAQEKGNDALKLDYSGDGKEIVNKFQKYIDKVWKKCLVIAFVAPAIGLGGLVFLDRSQIFLMSVILSFLSLTVFPLWKELIEYDETAHEALNELLIYRYGRIYGQKRKKEVSFGRLYWNCCLKYKIGLMGIIALAVLDLFHMKICRGKFRDPLREYMITSGENWNVILRQEGILDKVKILKQKSSAH
jgi:hypothetical protein